MSPGFGSHTTSWHKHGIVQHCFTSNMHKTHSQHSYSHNQCESSDLSIRCNSLNDTRQLANMPYFKITLQWVCHLLEYWLHEMKAQDSSLFIYFSIHKSIQGFTAQRYRSCHINLLTPNDDYSGRTAPLTSKRCILYIYSTHIGTEYFKHGI